VAKRYLTGGLDRQLAVRIYTTESGYLGALALLSNRQGTVLGAMRPNGLRETTVKSFSTDAFGKVAGADGAGTTNPEVGFAGASTGDPQGGFTYLRNRWYDPQTGRFLTQDPIGLAGGVNLYAYAGNNPVMFSDPFGLCPWHDVECWEDKMWAASGGTGFAGRVLAPLASTALELSGASGVDQSSKAAAGGSKMAMAALVLDIGSSAIPGGSEGKAGVRALIRDATENPGAWKSVASFVEKAVSKKARGGISIQRVIQNEAGDQLVEHTILNKAGEVVEQHFRPMLKPPVEP
jgi:RHS repeat-associated protein